MNVLPTAIPDVLILEPRVFADDRGCFFESFNRGAFAAAVGHDVEFVQDNQSVSRRNVLRGLHHQDPRPQVGESGRMSTATSNTAPRTTRTSFPCGRWVSVELTAANRRQLWVPPGLAHGFLVLSDEAELLYKTTDFYAPDCERCIAWNDPVLAIDWPLTGPPLLSPKDARGEPFQPRG